MELMNYIKYDFEGQQRIIDFNHIPLLDTMNKFREYIKRQHFNSGDNQND